MQSSHTGLCWVSLGHQLEQRPGCCSSLTKCITNRKPVGLFSHGFVILCFEWRCCCSGLGCAEGVFPKWLQDLSIYKSLGSWSPCVVVLFIPVTWEGCTCGKWIGLTNSCPRFTLEKKTNQKLEESLKLPTLTMFPFLFPHSHFPLFSRGLLKHN